MTEDAALIHLGTSAPTQRPEATPRIYEDTLFVRRVSSGPSPGPDAPPCRADDFVMKVATDRRSYEQGARVEIAAELHNIGEGCNGRLFRNDIAIRDDERDRANYDWTRRPPPVEPTEIYWSGRTRWTFGWSWDQEENVTDGAEFTRADPEGDGRPVGPGTYTVKTYVRMDGGQSESSDFEPDWKTTDAVRITIH